MDMSHIDSLYMKDVHFWREHKHHGLCSPKHVLQMHSAWILVTDCMHAPLIPYTQPACGPSSGMSPSATLTPARGAGTGTMQGRQIVYTCPFSQLINRRDMHDPQ